MNDTQKPQTDSAPADDGAAGMVRALSSAVERLTSQVFLFLIAYLILMIFLIRSAASIPDEVRIALVVLPVLGIGAYTYLQRRKITASTQKLDVRVKAVMALSKAEIKGVVGDAPPGLRSVDVGAGFAAGGAKVIGVERVSNAPAVATDLAYLTDLFGKLTVAGRNRVIDEARRVQSEQLATGK